MCVYDNDSNHSDVKKKKNIAANIIIVIVEKRAYYAAVRIIMVGVELLERNVFAGARRTASPNSVVDCARVSVVIVWCCCGYRREKSRRPTTLTFRRPKRKIAHDENGIVVLSCFRETVLKRVKIKWTSGGGGFPAETLSNRRVSFVGRFSDTRSRSRRNRFGPQSNAAFFMRSVVWK